MPASKPEGAGDVRGDGRRRWHRRRIVRLGTAAAVVLVASGYAVRAVVGHSSTRAGPPAVSSASAKTGVTRQAPRTTSPRTSATAITSPVASPGRPVPVLMYHVIESPPASAPYPDLYLPPSLFRSQIRYLRARGYHAVTLDQVWRYWHNHLRLPRRPIVLSFDDGYLSQYTVAARFLARYDWPGVLNLVVKHLHEGSYGLTVGRVRKMIAAGWEVDSHTIDHLDVTTLDGSQLRREVAGSRVIFRRMFHQPVNFFCYPAGAYDVTAIQAVRAAGYLGATTTIQGLASPRQDPYELDRIRVNGTETAAQLRAALQAGQ